MSATPYAHMVLAVVVMAALVLPARGAVPGNGTATVTVDAATELGPTNGDLLGMGWNTGTLNGVAPLAPPTVRIDAGLEHVSTHEGSHEFGPLLDKVAAVRAVGAEPHVILSYMPPWLARTGPGDPRDPTRLAPSDFDLWQALVEDVVEALATAPAPAFRFEVWNEPDLPTFWQDSPADFLELARRTHAAVAAVEAATGLDLEIGGPAAAFPDPLFIVPYVEANAPDFVSWHFYGNHPLCGPDGNEGFIPDELYQVAAHRNPLTTPREFSLQVEMVRLWVGPDVDLVIDEWNVSAGGFDVRHDTNEGAAFDAASLIEMERSGLAAADFYRASNQPGDRAGDWGLTRTDGTPKPAWWVFRAWQATAGRRLAVDVGTALDLFARATKGNDRTIDVLLSSFAVQGGRDRRVTVEVGDVTCAKRAIVRVLATPDGDLAATTPVPVIGDAVTFDLPSQSVAWVTFRRCR